jgi:hypothetical protein
MNSPPRTPRPRRYISPRLLAALRPLLRYSTSRGAYVLPLIGSRLGPVIKPRTPAGPGGGAFGGHAGTGS